MEFSIKGWVDWDEKCSLACSPDHIPLTYMPGDMLCEELNVRVRRILIVLFYSANMKQTWK